MTSTLMIGDGLDLPVEAVTETFAILGVRGSGKSTTASRLVEQLVKVGKQQCVVVDPTGAWWGIKSSADGRRPGLPFVILGGEHGDLPLDEGAGEAVADLVIGSGGNYVLDLSLMRKGAQQRVVLAFEEALYHRNRTALMVVIDEADLFAPQRPMKGQERLLGALEDHARRGRRKGLGMCVVTQRPASLHKDVLSQLSVLVAHRLVGPQDRAAIDAWVEAHGERDKRDQLVASLAGLNTGEAWWWSPVFLDVFQRTISQRPDIFDSMATPKPGERPAVPKAATAVDVEAIRGHLASFVEAAEANDPAQLRRRITELEHQLRTNPTTQPVVTEIVERLIIPAGLAEQVAGIIPAGTDGLATEIRDVIDRWVTTTVNQIGDVFARIDTATAVAAPAAQPPRPARRTTTRPAPSPLPAPAPDADAAERLAGLRAGARRIFETVAQFHPRPLTDQQVGTLANFKITGGTYSSYRSALRAAGLVDYAKGEWTLTDIGATLIGTIPARTITAADVQATWLESLKRRGPRVMLEHLLDQYPNTVTKDELATHVEMTVSGGSFNSYLSTLRSNGLATIDGQNIRAADALFLTAG